MSNGHVHSFESCGTVDGPGIRFVVFLQGCPLRCQYCHNPDTWDPSEGTIYSAREIVEEAIKYKSYMKFSGGGITLTGGEPLLQSEFVQEIFSLCKEQGISTALDTSGFLFHEQSKEVLKYTDLVLLDIKNFNPAVYKTVTGAPLEPTLNFLNYLKEHSIPTWIRYVLVPDLTDNLDDIKALSLYLKDYPNVEQIELLPFHKMGEYKWEHLGRPYQLKDTKEPSKELIQTVKQLFEQSGIKVVTNE